MNQQFSLIRNKSSMEYYSNTLYIRYRLFNRSNYINHNHYEEKYRYAQRFDKIMFYIMFYR